jgi:signal transduction histidine kinase
MVFVQLQERTVELREKAEQLHEAQARAHEREMTMQRRRWEAEALEAQMAQMAEHDRRKDEFLAILAHELRNPLQPLQTAVELMAHEPDQPVPARVRNIIQRQVHTIGRLVDDLLDVARFTAGKLDLRREQVAIDGVIDEAVTAVQALAAARKQTLTVRVDASSGGERAEPDRMVVFGDPVRLVQVLVNLLSNAIKYTPQHGVIEVRSGVTDGQAFMRVSDNGKGIPAALLPRVFEMFVQERVMASGAGGLGLGLGLVRRLVELHGGSVHAASAGTDRGATFEVRLPLAEGIAVPRTPTPIAGTPPLQKPLRAVVVDDAPDLRELVADLLRMRGHAVTAVEDGPSAIEAIRREQPDVALIDIGLPEMDGYAVARAVRSEQGKRPLRLIAMTGYGQASDRESAFAAGFDAHIVKPASADKILNALYGPAAEES